jgi:DNA-binding response OmpR family regulator
MGVDGRPPTMSDRATILIVDDEPSITDLYALRLEDEYDVRTAYSGSEALEKIDDDVGVVLLDRRMPDLSGDDVLAKIREDGIECRVAMVTAVDPDFDILDLGFDAYVVKPVSENDLKETVDTLLRRSEYDDKLQELTGLMSKKAALESEKTQDDLEHNEEYQRLKRRLDGLRAELDETVDELDEEDFSAAFYALSRRRSGRPDADDR